MIGEHMDSENETEINALYLHLANLIYKGQISNS